MIRVIFLFSILLHTVFSDEIRPAFLELTQQSETSYKVLWKKPSQGEVQNPLKLEPVFPSSTRLKGVKKISKTGNSILEMYVIEESSALINKPINIQGLEATSSDVLVRILYLDGETEFIRVLPEDPHFMLTHKSGFYNMAMTYFILGVEHILEGFDHLLFVLALLLLVGNIRVLIWTITAFTLAHTMTLILSSLDIVYLSISAVEAIIALSIVFVAAEVVYAMRGREYLSKKYPWLIAFGFGLIHGLGFAEALKEIGLPQNEIVPSMIFFNIGVEIGQLLFVAAILLFTWIFRSIIIKHRYIYKTVVAYAIGSIATFWFLERVLTV
ncbi:HupE/UreJ family protein [Sulfurovum sp.]|uniref:HupE/UreJ family protein n=1 Tax=Sulfurovum sp. TaxID=1969726 RepID=UPI002867C9F3|nr:HupE/UreJ family protein [Sulfurovum sp.]